MTFLEELREQRWDDHRYYHHSRVNQSLHLQSALSFLTAYALLAVNPVASALLGWIVAMWSRQIGHFFFEPKGYDEVNEATHEHKEDIKIGYNLRRKVVLLGIWAALPFALYVNPSLFGLFAPHSTGSEYVHNLAVAWLWLGAFAILFRTIQLAITQDLRTGLVWVTKILTDPFHDVKIYHKSPLYLLRGELIDPMTHTHR
ncbi:MAG: hypothetical protein AAGE01_01570 [Pseudomonadota bacterium]